MALSSQQLTLAQTHSNDPVNLSQAPSVTYGRGPEPFATMDAARGKHARHTGWKGGSVRVLCRAGGAARGGGGGPRGSQRRAGRPGRGPTGAGIGRGAAAPHGEAPAWLRRGGGDGQGRPDGAMRTGVTWPDLAPGRRIHSRSSKNQSAGIYPKSQPVVNPGGPFWTGRDQILSAKVQKKTWRILAQSTSPISADHRFRQKPASHSRMGDMRD